MAQNNRTPGPSLTAGSSAMPDPSLMTVWCADPEAAAPLLKALDCPGEAALPTQVNGPLLLLHLSARDALSRAGSAGSAGSAGALEAALQSWRHETDALLRLARSDRRQVHLADLTAALADPAALWAVLDLPGRPPKPASALDPAPADAADPDTTILDLLIDRMVLGDPQARTLGAQLQAASLDLPSPPPAPRTDPDTALESWRAQRGTLELLTEQAAALQGELAGQAAGRSAAERERAALDLALEAARAEAAEAGQRDAAQIDFLKAQIGAMQDELETIARGRQQLEARLEQMGQGLDSHQRRIDALEGDNARQKTRLAEKEAALKAAARQLAELETGFQARARAGDAETRRLGAALDNARREAGETAQALEQARSEGRQSADELARVLGSRSYRVTAPLRWLRALLGGGRH